MVPLEDNLRKSRMRDSLYRDSTHPLQNTATNWNWSHRWFSEQVIRLSGKVRIRVTDYDSDGWNFSRCFPANTLPTITLTSRQPIVESRCSRSDCYAQDDKCGFNDWLRIPRGKSPSIWTKLWNRLPTITLTSTTADRLNPTVVRTPFVWLSTLCIGLSLRSR
jgi:hypothetical protein